MRIYSSYDISSICNDRDIFFSVPDAEDGQMVEFSPDYSDESEEEEDNAGDAIKSSNMVLARADKASLGSAMLDTVPCR